MRTFKRYKCSKCRHVKKIDTNHYGQCYSWGHYNTCPNCPPHAKYPEYGGSTTWDCMDKKIEFVDVPDQIKQTILAGIMDTKPPTREEEKAEIEAMVWHNEISEYNRAKYGE